MQNVEQPRTGSVNGHEINPIEISMAPTYRENVQGACQNTCTNQNSLTDHDQPLRDVLPCPEILQWTLSVLVNLSVLERTP